MVFPTWIVLILGVLCYFVLPFAIWCFIKNEKAKNIVTAIFFALYCVVLFCGVFARVSPSLQSVSIVFDFSGAWAAKSINWGFVGISIFDLVINLVMLLPVGMAALYFTRRKRTKVKIVTIVLTALLSGVLIELCQFLLPIPRGVQLSDAVLNAVSVTFGALLAWLYLVVINKIKVHLATRKKSNDDEIKN
ncbi:MAG: VanZ family protein [Clostridia bacterium]|nr:VanZ family protein [Clostridia bacterium]